MMEPLSLKQLLSPLVKAFLGLSLLSAALAAPLAQANWESASQSMEKVTDQMLVLVADEELRNPENIGPLMQGVDEILGEQVDYDYIGKSVMGKYVRRASDEEVSRFSGVFKDTILRTFAKAVSGFDFKGYETLPPVSESPEPDKQIVSVNLMSNNGQIYSLVFYVVRDGDNWKLVNVLIDGINLRVTFRNQFANLMEKYSKVGAAIEHWEEAMSSVAEGGA